MLMSAHCQLVTVLSSFLESLKSILPFGPLTGKKKVFCIHAFGWCGSKALVCFSFDSDILPDEDVYQMPNKSRFVSVFPPVLGSSSLSHTVLCRHVRAFIQAHTQHNQPPLALTTWNILDKCFYCRNPLSDTPNFHHNKQPCSSKHAAPVWSDHRGGQCLWAFFCQYANFVIFKQSLSGIQIRAW